MGYMREFLAEPLALDTEVNVGDTARRLMAAA